mgnify:CR=1 FL=1
MNRFLSFEVNLIEILQKKLKLGLGVFDKSKIIRVELDLYLGRIVNARQGLAGNTDNRFPGRFDLVTDDFSGDRLSQMRDFFFKLLMNVGPDALQLFQGAL